MPKNIFSSKFIKYLLKVGKLFLKQFLKLILESLEFFFYPDIQNRNIIEIIIQPKFKLEEF